MGAISLVEKDIERGRKIVELLDKKDFPVTAALWVYYHEIDRWTLLIATPRFKEGRKDNIIEEVIEAHQDLLEIIRHAGEEDYYPENGNIQMVPVDDPTIKVFEEKMGPIDKVGGVRRQATRVESKHVSEFIEDALIYRTAA